MANRGRAGARRACTRRKDGRPSEHPRSPLFGQHRLFPARGVTYLVAELLDLGLGQRRARHQLFNPAVHVLHSVAPWGWEQSAGEGVWPKKGKIAYSPVCCTRYAKPARVPSSTARRRRVRGAAGLSGRGTAGWSCAAAYRESACRFVRVFSARAAVRCAVRRPGEMSRQAEAGVRRPRAMRGAVRGQQPDLDASAVWQAQRRECNGRGRGCVAMLSSRRCRRPPCQRRRFGVGRRTSFLLAQRTEGSL